MYLSVVVSGLGVNKRGGETGKQNLNCRQRGSCLEVTPALNIHESGSILVPLKQGGLNVSAEEMMLLG